jgi:hypothetical protein
MLVPTPTTRVRMVASKFRSARVGPTQPAAKLRAAELRSGSPFTVSRAVFDRKGPKAVGISDGNARPLEQPLAADLARHRLDRWTLAPI